MKITKKQMAKLPRPVQYVLNMWMRMKEQRRLERLREEAIKTGKPIITATQKPRRPKVLPRP